MNSSLRDLLWFHGLFFGIALPCALLLEGPRLGQALLGLAIAYNLALPLAATLRGHPDWLRVWLFLLPLSCAQVLPDWALVQIAGTLVFPDHGVPRVGGAVPVYFMGLWMMALLPLLLIADSRRSRYLTAAFLSLLVFALWEWAARPLALWQPVGVPEIAGVAWYVLPPEVLLTLSALWLERNTRDSGVLARIGAGLAVPVFYTGALMLSLLLSRAL